jgi:hypothetical protein
MPSFGGKGEVSGSTTHTKGTRWYDWQEKLGKDIYKWLRPKVGKEATPYTGRLPGTYGLSGIQRGLVSDAEQGKGAFAAYSNIANPEEWKKRTAERAETRESWLTPRREKEDALLKEQMVSMGLSHSSDMVKAQMDQRQTRETEDTMFRQGMYDRYEQMGIEAAPELIEMSAAVGEMDRSIKEAGLAAKYQEWLRTQPEYSPFIEHMMRLLEMEPSEDFTTNTLAFKASAEAGW